MCFSSLHPFFQYISIFPVYIRFSSIYPFFQRISMNFSSKVAGPLSRGFIFIFYLCWKTRSQKNSLEESLHPAWMIYTSGKRQSTGGKSRGGSRWLGTSRISSMFSAPSMALLLLLRPWNYFRPFPLVCNPQNPRQRRGMKCGKPGIYSPQKRLHLHFRLGICLI